MFMFARCLCLFVRCRYRNGTTPFDAKKMIHFQWSITCVLCPTARRRRRTDLQRGGAVPADGAAEAELGRVSRQAGHQAGEGRPHAGARPRRQPRRQHCGRPRGLRRGQRAPRRTLSIENRLSRKQRLYRGWSHLRCSMDCAAFVVVVVVVVVQLVRLIDASPHGSYGKWHCS